MRAGRTIMRRLTRVLALVLTVVFALSTFHVHGTAASTPDGALAIVAALDDAGHAAEKGSDGSDRHAAADCPVCALLTHILGPAPAQTCLARSLCREHFVLGSETRRPPPIFEHDRPPIARTV